MRAQLLFAEQLYPVAAPDVAVLDWLMPNGGGPKAAETLKAKSDEIRIVGISAGVSYGALGTTHHSLHDFAALRAAIGAGAEASLTLGIAAAAVVGRVAASDPDGILATPVETVERDRRNKTGKHLRRLAQLTDELEAVEVVVGLPRTLADRSGSSARDAVELADQLARRIALFGLDVVRVDRGGGGRPRQLRPDDALAAPPAAAAATESQRSVSHPPETAKPA